MPSAHNSSASSAEPFTSQLNEVMNMGQENPGKLDIKTFIPVSGKGEAPGYWEDTPGSAAGLPGWPGMSEPPPPMKRARPPRKARKINAGRRRIQGRSLFQRNKKPGTKRLERNGKHPKRDT